MLFVQHWLAHNFCEGMQLNRALGFIGHAKLYVCMAPQIFMYWNIDIKEEEN